jgi:shikimate dehydrogenase
MDKGKELIKLALFGRPVKSSLSPSIHGMFADQLGLYIDYQSIETSADGFPQALETFRLDGGVGCNITLPLKGDAYQLASGCTDQVSQAQAANTLVHQPSGWFAHNTDGGGLIADLSANNGVGICGRRVLILGAGGATAGILGSLLAQDPAEVVMANRNLDRARALSERFKLFGKIRVINWEELPLQGGFDLVINATSLGHQGKAPPLVESLFAPGGLCYDLNYYRASLPLKALCEAMEQRYIDGLGMLVEQAASSFEIWTTMRPDSKPVIDGFRDKAY